MNAAEIVRTIMTQVGMSQKKLATKVGLKAQQALFNKLNNKNGMRVDSFIKIMEALGYDVMVKNRVTDEMIRVEVTSCDTDMVE